MSLLTSVSLSIRGCQVSRGWERQLGSGSPDVHKLFHVSRGAASNTDQRRLVKLQEICIIIAQSNYNVV